MTCGYCGASNDGEAVSCSSCGKSLAEPDRPAPPQLKVQAAEADAWELSPALDPWNTAPDPNIRPSLPQRLKVVGYANVIVGPLLAIVNLIVVGKSIAEMEAGNAPEGLSTFLWINIAIYFGLGILLVVGGVGLLRNRKWGRTWSLVAGVCCVLAMVAVSIVANVMKSLLESGVLPLHPGQQSFYFNNVAGVAGFSPLYGILLIVLLMLPDARAWATRGVAASPRSGGGSGSTGTVVPGRATSGLAIASLVCSIIPFVLITQIAGLTLGIVALVKIKRSNGTLGGRGFAIAGIAISGTIILLLAGILLVVFLVGGFK